MTLDAQSPLDLRTGTTDLRDAADNTTADAANPTDTLYDAAPSGGPARPELPFKSIDDLRRLNRSATQWGMYTGMAGGGALTYAAHRMRMPKNGLVATFLLSSTTISFLYTRSIIRSALGEQSAAQAAAREPIAPGGGTFLGDDLSAGDAAAPKTGEVPSAPPGDPRIAVFESVRTVNMPRERTMWAKGRGLAGEVEEEEEMGDAYLRPGVPRRDV